MTNTPSSTYAKDSFHKIKEFLFLLGLNLWVSLKEFFAFFVIAYRYYGNWKFCKIDFKLRLLYLFNNGFAISKKYMQEKQAEQIYVYGETPLPTWEQIAKSCQISAKDTLIELGCGRGRVCFWSHCFLGCKVIGLEQIPVFVTQAQSIVKEFELAQISFEQEDFLKADLSQGTVLYLYGSCMEDADISKLAKVCSKLASGTKIITVSFNLDDYLSGKFEIMKCFPAQFTWGTGDVFLQVVK